MIFEFFARSLVTSEKLNYTRVIDKLDLQNIKKLLISSLLRE
jgi:hypothetical protein